MWPGSRIWAPPASSGRLSRKNISAKKTGEPHHNWNNRSLLEAGRKLGHHAYAPKRNTDGCQQSGLCSYGCPFDAKKGTLLAYIPRAMNAGADLYSNCRVENIVHKNGVFSHVTGTISDKESGAAKHSIKVKAKVLVILQCQAVPRGELCRRRGGRANRKGTHSFA